MADAPRLVSKHGKKVAPKLIEMPAVAIWASRHGEADVSTVGGDKDISVNVFGLGAMQAILENMGRAARRAAAYEMSNWLWEVMDLSKAEYVPKDTMALYDSGMADEYDDSMDQPVIQMAAWYAAPGYVSSKLSGEVVSATDASGASLGTFRQSAGHGGGMTLRKPEDYALAQHETLYEHYTNGGGPKYLEKPFNMKSHEVFPRLAQAIVNCWGGGGGEAITGALGMDVKVLIDVHTQCAGNCFALGMDVNEYLAIFGPEFGSK